MLEVKEFTVHDRLGRLIVKGELLADYRYGSEIKPRWTDMAIYRIAQDEERPRPFKLIESKVKRLVESKNKRSMHNSQRAALSGILPQLVQLVYDEQPVYKYAIEIIAHSYVYHRIDAVCVQGDRHLFTTVGNVRESNHRWKNLFPCDKCGPPDLEQMAPDVRIAEEQSDTYVYLCTSGSDVINRLYRRSGEVSILAAKMLNKAARHDAEIANALQSVRKV